MRLFVPAALLLAACSPEAAAPESGLKEKVYFAADGRSRLCVFPGAKEVAIIAFKPGSDINCSAAGQVEGSGNQIRLVPAGERECRIPLVIDGSSVTVGRPGAACDYYCGPGAAWGGQAYRWVDTGTANTVAEPLMPTDRC